MARGGFNKNRGRGGGGGGRGRGRGRGGGGGGQRRQYQDNRQSFDEVEKKNEKFERFYNTIDVVPAGVQRDNFWATLRKELPNSFRFTGSKGHALSVRNNLTERFFPIIKDIKHEGKPVELPTQIPWYPSGLAYRMTTPKNVIRKYDPFKEFQRFLVSETGVGNISRQEEVSMIPPLLLDVESHHTVLDLCAAPGSKSAQLVEAIHNGEETRVAHAISKAKGDTSNGASSDSTELMDGGRSTGLLVANDVNYQRAQMLVHQVKRLNSPNLLVTNHDATMFPSIELPSPAPAPGQQKKGKWLKFDRILADVPCSGDGTCRKNPGIWKDWSPQNGLGLYITQVRILTRSLQMLKVGGRVVYSTCSMNPVENEAVIASAIERCGGVSKVKLVDCSDRLPNLARSKGLTDWSIMSRQGQIYESFPEAEQYEPEGSKVVPGMFAPGPEERIPLEHCMRVYPHQQDTGGFFITVLEKLSEIKAKPEADSKCMKRDWKFEEAEREPSPVVDMSVKTDFTAIMEEVAHPNPPSRSEVVPDSAAAIQNDADVPSADASASLKRKADEDQNVEDAGIAKKPRIQDSGDAVEVMENGALPADSVPVTEEVAEAVQEAPFEKSVPGDIQQPVRRKRGRDDAPNEEAFKYLAPDHQELERIYGFYELHASFPRDRFLVRNPAGDPVKGIYYSSQLVKDILTANEGRGMKFVHGGVKMFMRQDAQGQDICRWRIQTEGLPIVEGWVGDSRVVRLWKRSTLRKLLVEMFPKIGGENTVEGDGWRALGEIGEQALKIGMGCCVLRVEARGGEDGFDEEIVLPLWRSMHSLNLMLPKEDRRAMLLRIYNEDVELVNHSDPRQRRAQEVASATGGAEGSSSAQGDAKEPKDRMANGGHDDSATIPASLVGGCRRRNSSSVEPEFAEPVLESRAIEEDAIAKEDRAQADALNVKEEENAKIAAAMPEREGEGDEVKSSV